MSNPIDTPNFRQATQKEIKAARTTINKIGSKTYKTIFGIIARNRGLVEEAIVRSAYEKLNTTMRFPIARSNLNTGLRKRDTGISVQRGTVSEIPWWIIMQNTNRNSGKEITIEEVNEAIRVALKIETPAPVTPEPVPEPEPGPSQRVSSKKGGRKAPATDRRQVSLYGSSGSQLITRVPEDYIEDAVRSLGELSKELAPLVAKHLSSSKIGIPDLRAFRSSIGKILREIDPHSKEVVDKAAKLMSAIENAIADALKNYGKLNEARVAQIKSNT